MSDVFLFPGLGSEVPGMGGAALSRPGPVRRLFEQASAVLAVDLAAVVSRGNAALARTELGQPALVLIEIGLALEAIAAGLKPAAIAGHSAGEVAAFCVAGCLSPEEAVDVVIARARFLVEAAAQTRGTMAALRADSQAQVDDALALGRTAGQLEVAAHNSPDEWVLTGDRTALAAVAARFATVALPVSGPWHSPAMAPAAVRWRAVLAQVRWQRPSVPLMVNATGAELQAGEDPAELLAGQLTAPVKWAESMQTLVRLGAARWHVFGPGRVMRGLCRANLGREAAIVLHEGDALEELRA